MSISDRILWTFSYSYSRKSRFLITLRLIKYSSFCVNIQCMFLACEISKWANLKNKSRVFSKSKYPYLYSWLFSLELWWKEWASTKDSHSFNIFRANNYPQWTWREEIARKAREDRSLHVSGSIVAEVDRQWKKQVTYLQKRKISL